MAQTNTVKVSILVAVIVIAILGIFLFNKQTGNVIIEYSSQSQLGDPISGDLSIILEEGDSVEKDSPIIISLSKGDKVLAAQTLTLEEFIRYSGSSVSPVSKDNGYYYETPGKYTININTVLPYTLNETGNYELFFNMFKLDLAVKKTITVE